jgi:hypothetical protein
MNGNQLKLRIVEEILEAIEHGKDDISIPELGQEELDTYSEYLLHKGLVTFVRGNGNSEYLQTSESGKALLALLRKLNCFTGHMVPDDPAEQDDWTPARGKAETAAWHDRMMVPYVLEQAEVTRLEAQLKQDYDEEAMQELEDRLHRMETLRNLLETMQKLRDSKPDSMLGG